MLRGRSIRTYLVLLVLATLAPAFAVVTAVLALNARLHEHVTEARLIEVARVLALAVDRDLRAAQAALDVLAGSGLLDNGDLRTFYERAVKVGRRHGGWIVLRDRHNRQILNTAVTHNPELPTGSSPETFDVAVRSRAPYVSDLYIGPVLQRPMIAVGMPVTRGDDVRYVLDMGLPPEHLAALLESPQREPSWTVAVFDRKGVVVAAAPDVGLVGRSPAPELVAAMRENTHGWMRSTTFRNAPAYFAFARVPHAGWSVAIGIPVAAAYADVQRALYATVAGAVIGLTLGVLLAALLGRRIATPLAALAAAARQGAAENELHVGSAIAEVNDLQTALREAGVSRRREERERQQRVTEETRRAVAEEALASAAASETRWHALFEQAGEAVIIGDTDLVCREANPAACRLLGYAAEKLVGRSVADIVAPEEVARLGEALNTLLTGATHVGEWTLVGHGNRRIEAEVNTRMLADGRWQAFIRDVTERREMERERARVLALERSARAEAEAASRMKDEFLATLSHELRTPLNTIATWSRLLRAGRLDAAAVTRALDIIDRSVQAQSMLVRDLLDVSRIIRGDFALDLQPADMSAIVVGACEALRPTAHGSGVALHCSTDPEITGTCDADRLQQIVWNLVTNALKFTPSGGRIDVRLERVEPGQARLVVTDTGRGIPREFLPRLFERFEQLDAGGPMRTRGLGIGLAIVKYLVERHGGTVTADSPGPGHGATFTVILPVAP